VKIPSFPQYTTAQSAGVILRMIAPFVIQNPLANVQFRLYYLANLSLVRNIGEILG
jgi:hypothetical protein